MATILSVLNGFSSGHPQIPDYPQRRNPRKKHWGDQSQSSVLSAPQLFFTLQLVSLLGQL